jgi:D-xylose transport system permease protein
MTAVATPPVDDTHEPSPTASIGAAVSDYVSRVRGGDVGALPAVLGLVALVIVFSALRPESFTKPLNIANLINQSSALIVIAMGLVFVLLLGEIDLSAGYTAGTAASVMAVVVTRHSQPWPLAVLAGLGIGLLIGSCIGLLVSRLGIPSFVVTLAAFLGLQGVLLKIVGSQGTISIRDKTLVAINNNNLPVWASWLMFVLLLLGYAGVSVSRAVTRRRDGLVADPLAVVVSKVVVLAVLLGAATAFLSQERSPNPPRVLASGVTAGVSIKGVPEVVVLLVVLLVGLNFLLGRTAFGRHVYAVGGNAEAARRSGISVQRVKLLCFIACSTLAAVGGILLTSRDNSVDPKTGGSDTLLYAVGAAVIGGTSLFGGKGKIMDAVLGGLVIAIIINGMGLLNASSAVVYIVTGIVLLVAASVDAISRRRAMSTGRV